MADLAVNLALHTSCSHHLFTPARWADSVVFVYPTWWFNMPAILKGYLDRSLCLGGAFDIPATKDDIAASNGAATPFE
jgi:putative NADPH-quinone reductase